MEYKVLYYGLPDVEETPFMDFADAEALAVETLTEASKDVTVEAGARIVGSANAGARTLSEYALLNGTVEKLI